MEKINVQKNDEDVLVMDDQVTNDQADSDFFCNNDQYYIDAGADHISLGTICFAPWKIKKIINNNTLIKT